MRFGLIRSDFGVDTSKTPATMTVAIGGSNYILIHDATSVLPDFKDRRIKVVEITDKTELDKEINHIRYIGVSMGTSVLRKVIEFLVASYSVYTQSGGKLFKITANSGGAATIKFVDTKTKASLKLLVTMLQRQEYSVDFQFPHALDANGNDYRMSAMPRAHASSWIEEANVIFGPQVNIFFKLAGTSEPAIKKTTELLGPAQWDDLKAVKNQDPNTMTVFVAKNIVTKTGHPWGVSLIEKTRVIVVQDRDSEDEFVKTVCHEFVHTLGDMKGYDIGHPGVDGDLMISYTRFHGVRISSELVSYIGRQ